MADERLDGWLVIDKPLGITSRDAVDRVARWFPRRTTIGHAGTLDPLATGVLVIAVGKATRLIEYVQDMGKTYTANFQLGATSATDDAEGPIEAFADAVDPGQATVEATLATFVGTIEQTPPAYSAAKIDGQRAYAKARAGSPTLPSPKLVRIDGIDLFNYSYPTLRVQIRCGKGTYIRSLARDLGARLGTGGYVAELRRDAIGGFTNSEAASLDVANSELSPLSRGVVALPRLELTDDVAQRFRMGQTISIDASCVGDIACFDGLGSLVAIGRCTDTLALRPVKVFH